MLKDALEEELEDELESTEDEQENEREDVLVKELEGNRRISLMYALKFNAI